MSTQAWTVDIDGIQRSITVDYDWQLGKASIRVDGRIAARPLANEENEREVVVGTRRYVVRRLPNDQWDLDVSPDTYLAPDSSSRRVTATATPVPARRSIVNRIVLVVGIVVVIVVVAGLVRTGREGFAYLDVPWKPYAAADATFKANFPGDPKRETDSRNINGDIWQVVSLSSEYKNHYYAVQHVDLRMVVTDSQSRRVMDRFFTGWMEGLGSKVQTTEESTLARNPVKRFVATLPAGTGDKSYKLPVDATMRGMVVLRSRRLFFVWTLAAASDEISRDLKEFMEAFEVPPPPAMQDVGGKVWSP
jgi:hypothetical protein